MRKRENIRHSQGGGSWQRITSSSVVVFEGGASPPSTPFLMPTHQGKDEQKKSAANVTKGWHIYLPVIYCICWRATRFFDWPLRTTYHFLLLRGLRVLYFPYLRVLWISPLMCSPIINSPCRLQHHLSKRQRHRRLTSAAFGDIIKIQNRRGGSLPKGR